MATHDSEPRTTLQQRRAQVTADALIEAAERGMIERGLDVTIDEIAALAGVGRRTVFRHFPTREDLLDAALSAAVDRYARLLPAYDGGDWADWLAEATRVTHGEAARAGRLVWDLETRVPPRLAPHLGALRRMFASVAATLWQAAGGSGTPPKQLRQTAVAHLSPLFTQAVLLDAEGTPELAAELAAAAIAAAVRDALGA